MWAKLFTTSLFFLLISCSSEPETGPVEIHWDRDICERCRMVISDPRFAAQIRYFPPEKRSKVAKFDDIGGALLWLDEQPWKKDKKTEIWVADHRTKEFINAKTAFYIHQNNTPMEYNLGAQTEHQEGALNFEQAIQEAHKVEERFTLHGLQLKQAAEAARQKLKQ